MLVRLIRDAKIRHSAGETVEVSPAEFVFLTSTRCAVAVPADKPAQEQPAEKTRGTRKK